MTRPFTFLRSPAAVALAMSALMAFTPALLSAQTASPSAAPPSAAPVPAATPAVPAAKPEDSGKELVAVMDLEAVGASKVEASAITDRLREELLKSGKFTLVDRSQMTAVLDEQALQQSGCTTQECAVKVGKVLGVRKLISGKVTKISETGWVVNATVVDVETSETLRAESLRHRGDYFSLLDEAISGLALKLATPAGRKPELGAYVAAEQKPQPVAAPAEPKKEEPAGETKGISKWWWVAGGAAVLGIAAASSSSKKSGGSAPNGSIGVNW